MNIEIDLIWRIARLLALMSLTVTLLSVGTTTLIESQLTTLIQLLGVISAFFGLTHLIES